MNWLKQKGTSIVHIGVTTSACGTSDVTPDCVGLAKLVLCRECASLTVKELAEWERTGVSPVTGRCHSL